MDRFIQEARTLSQFKHPNIMRVMRFFKANNTAYFVMDYEQGQSLADALEDGEQVAEAELRVILPPLLDALETVHNAGYLHRDIKPDNIYLRDRDNSPVLIDFGSARFEVNRRSRSVTSIVTPGYAPFEQYESDGSQQGAWTDIYALGAVLYRLIAGSAPMEATKRIRITLQKKPDPLNSALEIGSGKYLDNLLQAIDWALQLNPERRPPNIRAWRTQLLSLGTSSLTEPVPSSLPQGQDSLFKREKIPYFATEGLGRFWSGWYGVTILVLLIALGGYWFYYLLEKTPPPDEVRSGSAPLTKWGTGMTGKLPQSTPLDVEQQRLEAANRSAAQEAELIKRQLEQLRQQQLIQLAQKDAAEIGQKIWQNESSGQIEGLTTWNRGEHFASLGIGHFIWYPQGEEEKFTETFPELLEFMQAQGVILPDWLPDTPDCPWQTRQDFLSQQYSDKMVSLRTLMKNTVPIQVQFIIRRLEMALPKMLETLPTDEQRAHVRQQFYRVAKIPNGIYALIDYVHFKGEGINPSERYQGQGWGLLQVLQHMSGEATEYAGEEFADSAEFILKRRIRNAPLERNEVRWLRGWQNRIETYR